MRFCGGRKNEAIYVFRSADLRDYKTKPIGFGGCMKKRSHFAVPVWFYMVNCGGMRRCHFYV